MSKLVLFGVGTYYEKFKKICSKQDEIIGIIDNNPALWGTKKDGVLIMEPEEMVSAKYDYVIPLCAKPYEMKEQLVALGVSKEKICYFEEYRAGKMGDVIELYQKEDKGCRNQKREILIVSTRLDYNGGSLAAVYAAKALLLKGYRVVLAAPEGNACFIEEVVADGVDVAVCPGLPYLTGTLSAWIERFDAVIVNVFQMLVSACEISKLKPTLWWIHECSSKYEAHYEVTRKQYSEYEKSIEWNKLKVVGVSAVAAENFNSYYPAVIKDVLPYGIPDERDCNRKGEKSDKTIFSVIGNMCERKAQKLLLSAFLKLEKRFREQIEIWFIGSDTSRYASEVKEMAKEMPNVRMLGVKTREEIMSLYEKIDAVVCCSLEETMSITMTEGMMLGKICLCADSAGMADYMKDGVNGFVFRCADPDDLADRMKRVMELGESAEKMAGEAMQTYEKTFSMEVFGDRIEKFLLEIKGDER